MADSSGLGCSQDGQSFSAQLGFNSNVFRNMSANDPKSLTDPPLFASACQSGRGCRLVVESTVFEKASGGIGRDETLGSSMANAFQNSEKIVGVFPCLQAMDMSLCEIISLYSAEWGP